MIVHLYKYCRTRIFTCIAKIYHGDWKALMKANGYTKLSKRTVLGENVNFNGFIVYGNGRCSIGSNFHSGFGCKVLTSYHNYNGDTIPYDKTLITKDIIIENNVWLGINVTILGGVTIGEGAIIQAGSVVVSDIPAYAIAGGHPAKVFSYRDIEHYKKLMEQGRFF